MRRRLSSRAVWWLVAIGRLGGSIAVVAVVVALWMFFIRADTSPHAAPIEAKAPVVRQPQEKRPPERREVQGPDEGPLRAFAPPAQSEIEQAVFQIKLVFAIGIGGAVLFLVLYYILYSPPSSFSRSKPNAKASRSKRGESGNERPSREPKEEPQVWDLDDPSNW